MSPVRRIRVMIVDDSSVVRHYLRRALERCPDIEVIADAPDARIARDRIVALKPDVVTLDIEMPGIDGITLLRAIMTHAPVPVIIVSSIATEGSVAAIKALDAGAVDVIAKPGSAYNIEGIDDLIVERVRRAAVTPVSRGATLAAARQSISGARAALRAARTPVVKSTEVRFAEGQIVALGSSTGGTQALGAVLSAFPKNAPPVVMVQHITAPFGTAFAARLNSNTGLDVREATEGEELQSGMVRLAPAGSHLVVDHRNGRYVTRLRRGPVVKQQRPAADVLMDSVATAAGSHAVGAILTGMGDDGCDGLLAMRKAGAKTFAQDEATSAVYGMPRACMANGAASAAVPLPRMTATLLGALKTR